MAPSFFMAGCTRPDSHLEIVTRVTPMMLARWDWVMPARLRASLMALTVSPLTHQSANSDTRQARVWCYAVS